MERDLAVHSRPRAHRNFGPPGSVCTEDSPFSDPGTNRRASWNFQWWSAATEFFIIKQYTAWPDGTESEHARMMRLIYWTGGSGRLVKKNRGMRLHLVGPRILQ